MNDTTNLLPIGTVCRLKNGAKDVMITGFFPILAEEGGKIYDYSCCIFPDGVLGHVPVMVFNNSQIEKIKHMGLENDEEKEFKSKLYDLIKKVNDKGIDAVLKDEEQK